MFVCVIPGPAQLHEALGTLVTPSIVTEDWTQVISPPLAVAPGGMLSARTVTEAVDVHAFTGLVTVSTYTPGRFTTGFCRNWLVGFIPGPLHW